MMADFTDYSGYYILAGSGSRSALLLPDDKRIPLMHRLEDYVLKVYAEYPKLVLMSGMAEGWDEWVARLAIKHGLPLIAMIPNPTYGEYYWGRRSVTGTNRLQEFYDLCSYATDHGLVIHVMPTPAGFNGRYGHANFERNTRMVMLADSFVVYKPTSPGTAHCVSEMKRLNVPYEEIK